MLMLPYMLIRLHWPLLLCLSLTCWYSLPHKFPQLYCLLVLSTTPVNVTLCEWKLWTFFSLAQHVLDFSTWKSIDPLNTQCPLDNTHCLHTHFCFNVPIAIAPHCSVQWAIGIILDPPSTLIGCLKSISSFWVIQVPKSFKSIAPSWSLCCCLKIYP